MTHESSASGEGGKNKNKKKTKTTHTLLNTFWGISRINHHCNPNVKWAFVTPRLHHQGATSGSVVEHHYKSPDHPEHVYNEALFEKEAED